MTKEEALHDWYSLQDGLRSCSEKQARELLEAEKEGKNRERFLRRIHSRLNRLRAERERFEIQKGATS